MKLAKFTLRFVVAALASAYLTGLVRIVLGFVFRTDHPYLNLWNDILQFPIFFALVNLPATAVVLLTSIIVSDFAQRLLRFPNWAWAIICTAVFTAITIAIVANGTRWQSPIPIFSPYDYSWAEYSEPLLKLVVALALLIGGAAGASLAPRRRIRPTAPAPAPSAPP